MAKRGSPEYETFSMTVPKAFADAAKAILTSETRFGDEGLPRSRNDIYLWMIQRGLSSLDLSVQDALTGIRASLPPLEACVRYFLDHPTASVISLADTAGEEFVGTERADATARLAEAQRKISLFTALIEPVGQALLVELPAMQRG